MTRHLLAVLLLAGAAPLAAQQLKPLDPANMDTTCSACEDFFSYANGGWLKANPIPADKSSWGSFNELQEANYTALRQTLETAAANPGPDSDTRRLGLFYASCMDTTTINRVGAEPIRPMLDEIATLNTRADVEREIATLQNAGVGVGFSFRSGQDDKNSSRVIGQLSQGGLGLPDRDYYLKADSSSEALRKEYREHVGHMLALVGVGTKQAEAAAERVLALETALAQPSMTRVERRNPDSTYHLLTLASLQQLTPGFGWKAYLSQRKAPALGDVNVAQPRFYHALDSLLSAVPVETWRDYLAWQVLRSYAPSLGSDLEQESFRFNSTVMQGVTEMQPRWKRCIEATDRSLGEILGKAFVRTHFTPAAKARAETMVKNIRAALHERIGQLDWMSAATRQKAYAKLDAIVQKIGYPDKWRSYDGLEIVAQPYAVNVMHAREFDVHRSISKIGKPVDRTEWGMTPPTVNAYYNPRMNEVAFPAGIMQPPFFDPRADDAVNYGGMGAAIGHEISHGFDDQGRKYDAQGNLSGWWSDADAAAFEQRANKVVQQFDGFVSVDTFHVNGKLTLGENIADFAGLTIAYHAFRKSLEGKPEPAPIDGLTADQRFFLAWAQIWRQSTRPETAKLLVNVDPHAPARWRVNGPLANMPEFQAAFKCQAGDPMVAPAEARAKIW
ncbi:MAG TPA: M13 family metallopeptidase [Gemmatimonadales bacterium]|nr:M13 family metallopeptidase [Gemmatimonadales bacterium]